MLLGSHNCCGILGVRVLRQPGEQGWIFSSGSCNPHTVVPSVGCRTERGTGHAGKMDWNQQTTENSKSDLMCRRSGGSCCWWRRSSSSSADASWSPRCWGRTSVGLPRWSLGTSMPSPVVGEMLQPSQSVFWRSHHLLSLADVQLQTGTSCRRGST